MIAERDRNAAAAALEGAATPAGPASAASTPPSAVAPAAIKNRRRGGASRSAQSRSVCGSGTKSSGGRRQVAHGSTPVMMRRGSRSPLSLRVLAYGSETGRVIKIRYGLITNPDENDVRRRNSF
jgi:hypothetical protein